MKRSTDRILTTHVGSLVRPVEIVEAMRAIALREPYDESALETNLTKGVADVVKEQAAHGVDIPSDGEFGKHGWIRYIRERLGGIEPREGAQSASSQLASGRREYPGFFEVYSRIEQTTWLPRRPGSTAVATPAQAQAWVCTGPVTYIGHKELQRDIDNFKLALKAVHVEEAFMPVVAPCSAESPGGNEYYKDDESYLDAIADALNVEYRELGWFE